MEEENLYDTLPLHLVIGFYYYIKKEIKRGRMSQAMYHEIDLIKRTAHRRGISLDYVYKKGSLLVTIEKQIK